MRMARLRPSTRAAYKLAVAELESFASARGFRLDSPEAADHAVHLYCESLFFAGEPMYLARNALFGLCKLRGWSAGKPLFQKSKESLDGWAAKLPPATRQMIALRLRGVGS